MITIHYLNKTEETLAVITPHFPDKSNYSSEINYHIQNHKLDTDQILDLTQGL